MNEAIKDKIAAFLPDLKQSLKNSGDEVIVGGVTITRLEAEKICKEFERVLNSTSEICQIDWDVIPLKLCAANRNWRSLQESLNQI